MDYILASLLVPVPVFHLWLHALLSFWRRWPLLFYLWAALLWGSAYFIFSSIKDAFSAMLFVPPRFVEGAGFFLIGLGIVAIALSVYSLGIKRFIVWAVLKPESVPRKRIAGGVFQWIPHPAYLGHIVVMLGCLLATGKFYVALVVVFQLVVLPVVICLEEEELKKRLDAS